MPPGVRTDGQFVILNNAEFSTLEGAEMAALAIVPDTEETAGEDNTD